MNRSFVHSFAAALKAEEITILLNNLNFSNLLHFIAVFPPFPSTHRFQIVFASSHGTLNGHWGNGKRLTVRMSQLLSTATHSAVRRRCLSKSPSATIIIINNDSRLVQSLVQTNLSVAVQVSLVSHAHLGVVCSCPQQRPPSSFVANKSVAK